MTTKESEYSVRVILDVDHCHNDDGEDSDEPYSYRGTTSASLTSIRSTIGDWKGEFYHARDEIPANFFPVVGMPIYIVVVHYDTGDTFGSDERIEAVAAFETSEKAAEFESLIYANESVRDFDNIEYENVSVYPGAWKGYFEHINHVDNRLVILEP